MACFEEVALRDELRFEVMLRPGEASFINNYEVLHARTGFVDWDDPTRKRLLYRLWLEGRPPRPMAPEVQLYRRQTWGPSDAESLASDVGGWIEPLD